MLYNEILNKINVSINNPITYTDRAKQEMISNHFTDEFLKDILLHPKKIEEHSENNYIVYGKKTAKIRIEFTDHNSLLIHWIEYNRVAFIV